MTTPNHNHQAEQEHVQQQLSKLQNLRTTVIQAGTNKQHYEKRENEIYVELGKLGITASNLEEAKSGLQSEKLRITTEVQLLLPEGV
jgi:small-conductance mechanosensitive channel